MSYFDYLVGYFLELYQRSADAKPNPQSMIYSANALEVASAQQLAYRLHQFVSNPKLPHNQLNLKEFRAGMQILR